MELTTPKQGHSLRETTRGKGDNLSTPASSNPGHPACFGKVSNVAPAGGRAGGAGPGPACAPPLGAGGAAGEPRGDPPWGRWRLSY